MLPRDFGATLRRLRVRAGLTQQDVAHRAGLSLGAVRDLEQGRTRRPRPDSIAALAAALGAAPDELGPVEAERPIPAIRLLGPLEIGAGGALDGRGQALTLALLALYPDESVTHEQLADLIWPADRPESWPLLLRSYVARLRKRLAADAPGVLIDSRPGRYRLIAAPADVDAAYFGALLDEAERAIAAPARLDLLRSAAALWREPALCDIAELTHHPRVALLNQRRVSAGCALADAAVAGGAPDHALPVLAELIRLEPLDEGLVAGQIRALAAAGRLHEAHDTYLSMRRRLDEELGVTPGPALASAYVEVLDRPDDASPSAAGTRVRPAQLPRDLPDFTGRRDELDVGAACLNAAANGTGPSIVLVSGMGGLGKTSFAVHLAHQVRARFPAGQLFVDLDGVGRAPSAPAQVLEHFLTALGHRGDQLPGSLAELAALFRSATASGGYLIVLDNARDAEQVMPLLPGDPRCGVIITSRRALTELDSVRRIGLAGMSDEEGCRLLERAVGTAAVAAEPDAAQQLIRACEGLPLALRLTSARLATNPAFRIADVLSRLVDKRGGLDVLRSGQRAVRASFELSYQALSAEHARAFRLACLAPGTDSSVAAIAAAVGRSVDDTERLANELADRGLIIAVAADRYRFHDLVRAFAAELLDAEAAQRAEAQRRVLGWYLARAARASAACFPHRVASSSLPGLTADAAAEAADAVSTPAAAAAWLDAERTNLARCVSAAVAWDLPEYAWRIADEATAAFRRQDVSHNWIATAEAGLAAAEKAQDARGMALLHESLARAYAVRCKHAAAIEHYESGLVALDADWWPQAEVSLRENLGISIQALGEYDRAAREFLRSMQLAHEIGMPYWEAANLNDIGNVAAERGRLSEALRHYTAALDINAAIPDELGQFVNLSNMAQVERFGGQPGDGLQHIDQALASFEVDDVLVIAEAGILRAELLLDLGRAAEALRQAELGEQAAAGADHGGLRARALVVTGRCLTITGELDSAGERLGQALATARTAAAPAVEVEALLALAELCLERGDAPGCTDHADAAFALATQITLSLPADRARGLRERAAALARDTAATPLAV